MEYEEIYLHCGIANFTSVNDINTLYNTLRVGLHCLFIHSPFFPLGSRCSEPCSEGLWGRHCNQTCFKHCPNSDTCLRETGACVCRPGYWGVTCQNSECCCQPADIRSDQNQKCTGLHLPRLTLYPFLSQNAELACMVTSAVCHAHPVASRTAATM